MCRDPGLHLWTARPPLLQYHLLDSTLDGSALFPHGVLSPIATLVSLLVTQTLQLLASVCNLGQRSLFVCLNDKHRLKVGEPGYPLRSTKRGRRVMVSKGTVF